MFNDYFVTALVDLGVKFSIEFLSSSPFLGIRKALEQDAMSSSASSLLQPGLGLYEWLFERQITKITKSRSQSNY